ncbi:response regulator [Paenibacillus kandeliae]|uniref:response regulator n=1 Tax=Paenibacillus kandeliae TaxID=3231269 RepID=UPI003458129E
MYRVVVVDDEAMMLEGWQTMVEWGQYGFELCGMATDGQEGLDIVQQLQPDLLITDIAMPVLDGIGLIKALRLQNERNIRTVIVSGYSDFAYARQALQYEVDHYIIKPIISEEIHDMLKQLKQSLDEDAQCQQQLHLDNELAAAAAIARLLRGEEREIPSSITELLGMTTASKCWLIATANDDESSEQPMRQLSTAYRAAACQAWTFQTSPCRTHLLLITTNRNDEWVENMLHQELEVMNNAPAVWYCSASSVRLDELPLLYAQLAELKQQRADHTQIVRYGSQSYHSDNKAVCRLEDIRRCAAHLLKLIEQGSFRQLEQFITSLPDRYEGRELPVGPLRILIRHLLGELLRTLQTTHHPEATDGKRWLNQLLDVQPAEKNSWNLDTLKRLCINAGQLLQQTTMPSASGTTAIIGQAERHIRDHFREKLQLQQLARQFNLNAVYFGQQFKRATGHSFNDYVHLLRIEEAKKLLRRTDMKVADIADCLGYHDSDYFSAKFKALTNELPSTYKSRRQG